MPQSSTCIHPPRSPQPFHRPDQSVRLAEQTLSCLFDIKSPSEPAAQERRSEGLLPRSPPSRIRRPRFRHTTTPAPKSRNAHTAVSNVPRTKEQRRRPGTPVVVSPNYERRVPKIGCPRLRHRIGADGFCTSAQLGAKTPAMAQKDRYRIVCQ